jgi:hypothetical protein
VAGPPRRERCAAERNVVRFGVLRPVGRQRPQVLLDLRPAHAGNFAAPLPGQDQQLDQRAEWIAQPIGRTPHARQLLVGENAITRLLGTRGLHASTWRRVDDVALERPIAQLAHDAEYAVGHNRRPGVDDPVEQVEHVATVNVAEQATSPAWQNVPLEQPLRLESGA